MSNGKTENNDSWYKGKIWIIDFKIKIGMVCYTIKMKNNKNSFTKKTEFKY